MSTAHQLSLSWRGLRARSATIRLRLTLLYGVLFLVAGAALLTIGYVLVRHNISGVPFRRRALVPAHLAARSRPTRDFALIRQIHDQLVAGALHRLALEYLSALAAMTLLSAGAGWLMAGRVLAPLRDITATARRVSGENLDERIALSGPPDELTELADTFDGMLARLDAAFSSQRHFVANASHELRTPLAIMRTEIDVALADRDADAEELRAMGEAVRETVDRCERLIASLLTLARSQAALGGEETVDLAALAGDCITDLRARAQERQVRVYTDCRAAWTRGDARLLERMIGNLTDNGLRYNLAGGRLALSTGTADGKVRLQVRNSGPRIDAAQLQTLSEPFHRLDRGTDGFGLGLSIVRSVVAAHAGTIDIAAAPEGGLQVQIELPAVSAPASNVGVVQAPGALTRS